MQPLQICIGPTIRTDRESWSFTYAGLFVFHSVHVDASFESTFQHLNIYIFILRGDPFDISALKMYGYA